LPRETNNVIPKADSPLNGRDISTHYVQLDGLRGLAILLVMGYHFFLPHSGFHGAEAGILLQLAQMGWMGVDLFFVLSGFLITGILLQSRHQENYFRNFLMRRFLRIWPLYYLTLIGLILVLPLLLPEVPAELQSMQRNQAWFWLFGANWLFAKEGGFDLTSGGYYWSLAVEEQFYVIWPLAVLLLSARTLGRVCLGLLATSFVLRIVLLSNGVSSSSLYVATVTHWDGLAIGSLMATMAHSGRLARISRGTLLVTSAICVLGLATARAMDGDFFFWGRHMAAYGYSLLAVMFGALLAYTLRTGPSRGANRLFTHRFMTLSGKYSYALYLFHVPIASALFPLTFKLMSRFEDAVGYNVIFAVFFAAAFATSWIGAVLSWHFLEKRILKLKRHFPGHSPPGGKEASPTPG